MSKFIFHYDKRYKMYTVHHDGKRIDRVEHIACNVPTWSCNIHHPAAYPRKLGMMGYGVVTASEGSNGNKRVSIK